MVKVYSQIIFHKREYYKILNGYISFQDREYDKNDPVFVLWTGEPHSSYVSSNITELFPYYDDGIIYSLKNFSVTNYAENNSFQFVDDENMTQSIWKTFNLNRIFKKARKDVSTL